MRLLVSGGRKSADKELIFSILNVYHATFHFTEMVHGDAIGTDQLCEEWAEKHRLVVLPVPISPEDWTVYGKAAGCMRNTAMIRDYQPDIIIVFPGQNGTLDLLKKAIKYQKDCNTKAIVINVARGYGDLFQKDEPAPKNGSQNDPRRGAEHDGRAQHTAR